jgi:hypothetical protein
MITTHAFLSLQRETYQDDYEVHVLHLPRTERESVLSEKQLELKERVDRLPSNSRASSHLPYTPSTLY